MDQYFTKAFTQSIHGDFISPDILEIVKPIDFVLAGSQVDGLPNTIYQIVHHLVSWGTWGLKGATGNPFIRSQGDQEMNFFPADESPTEAQWTAVKSSLVKMIQEFETALPGIDHTADHSDWKSFNNGRAALFVVAHTAYHTAQVVTMLRLLKAYHRT